MQLAKLSKNFDEKLTTMSKSFDQKLASIAKDFDEKLTKMWQAQKKYVDTTLGRLGSRWGKDTERAFREGLKTVLEKEFGAKITPWRYPKKIPHIDPLRESYEIDVVISDEKIILLEIKTSVYEEQVEVFVKNVMAYEYIEKKKVHRKLLVTPLAVEEAKELADKYGVELISPPLSYYYTEDLQT
jgi:hypothetical protein